MINNPFIYDMDVMIVKNIELKSNENISLSEIENTFVNSKHINSIKSDINCIDNTNFNYSECVEELERIGRELI